MSDQYQLVDYDTMKNYHKVIVEQGFGFRGPDNQLVEATIYLPLNDSNYRIHEGKHQAHYCGEWHDIEAYRMKTSDRLMAPTIHRRVRQDDALFTKAMEGFKS